MLSAQKLIKLLDLQPLQIEGGMFTQSYYSRETIPHQSLPERYTSDHPFCTAIYFLLDPDSRSLMHRLKSDEVYHFYLGDPVTLLQLGPSGEVETVTLGQDIEAGQQVQHVVPRGWWQGSFLNEGGEFALMGTTIAPGFLWEDFELGARESLTASHPEAKTLIKKLTEEGT